MGLRACFSHKLTIINKEEGNARLINCGLFEDSMRAREVINRLEEEGFVESISVVSKKAHEDEAEVDQIKGSAEEGAAAGATVGGVAGALAGLAIGLGLIALPGGPLIVGGPLTAAWTAGGAVAGAVTGGLVGGLVDWGIPKRKAEEFKDSVYAGETLVAVTVEDPANEELIRNSFHEHGANTVETFRKDEL
jgi:uncharacterized membrane protein